MTNPANALPIITQDVLDRAAFQYAQITIRTLGGVATDLSVRAMSKGFPEADALLDECVDAMRDAEAILHGQSDFGSAACIDAYRTVQAAQQPFGKAIRIMDAWRFAAMLPGTLRDLTAFDDDPIAMLEARFDRYFTLKGYLAIRDAGKKAEDVNRSDF